MWVAMEDIDDQEAVPTSCSELEADRESVATYLSELEADESPIEIPEVPLTPEVVTVSDEDAVLGAPRLCPVGTEATADGYERSV